VCGASSLLLAQDFVTFKDRPSEELFVTSRAAVARGDGSIKNLRSLIFKGVARTAQDDGSQAESAVVIKVLLPDGYLRTDTFANRVMTTGFIGNRLLTTIEEGGRSSAPPASMTEPLLKSERARFTRLLVGTSTALSPVLRLIGRSAPGLGEMHRPGQGAPVDPTFASANEARLIELSGPDGFYLRFVVDAAKLPTRLEYRASKDEIWTTTFSDRRAVGGLLMPYRVVTTGRGSVREDLRFDEILVNPELAKGDFGK
jgi:hypothetical protein